ncbi:MAG TPA: HEAT repeat domain-containing protein [Tepidisphaeraceae bacterium]
MAVAALLRAALSDPEEAVRKASLLGLFHARSAVLEMALLAAALDPDEQVRRLALEGMAAVGSPRREIAAKLLANDADADVAETAAKIAQGIEIEYFELEGP